jgi:hypothetical protein
MFVRLPVKVVSQNDGELVDVILCHLYPSDVVNIPDHRQHSLLIYFQNLKNGAIPVTWMG